MIAGYSGVRFAIHSDLEIDKMIEGDGRVRLENPQYGIEYKVAGNTIFVKNLLAQERSLLVKWKNEERLVKLGENETWSYTCGVN